MPFAHHLDPEQKWQQQYLSTKNYILPFIGQYRALRKESRVLEVGCGEGGVLKACLEAGCFCHGIDIAPNRIENAKGLFEQEIQEQTIEFYAGDIHDTSLIGHLEGQIDLIILKDAIEHIPEQEQILQVLRKFLRKGGSAFVAFPPWINPFGGHQQIADSFLRFTPWLHLLPKTLYRSILKTCGETEAKIQALMEIYDTHISTGRFERIAHKTGWRILQRQFFLFNPIYEYKFGIKGRRQIGLVASMPVIRDFCSTGVYYLLH